MIDGVAALTGVGVELLDGDEEGFCRNADLFRKFLKRVGLDVELFLRDTAAGESGSLAAASVGVAFVHAGLVEDVPAGFARQAVLSPVFEAAERVPERVVVRNLVAEATTVVVDDDRVGVFALDVQGERHRGVDLLVVLAQLGVDGVAPHLAHHTQVGAHGLGHAQAAAVVGAVGGEVVVGHAYVVFDQLGVVLEAARRQQDAAVRLDLDLVAVPVLGDDADDLGNRVAGLALGDEALAGRVAEDLDAQVLLGGDEGVVEVVAASAERHGFDGLLGIGAATFVQGSFPGGVVFKPALLGGELYACRIQDVKRPLGVGKEGLADLGVVIAHRHMLEVRLGQLVGVPVGLRVVGVGKPRGAAGVLHGASHVGPRLKKDAAHAIHDGGHGACLPGSRANDNEVRRHVPGRLIGKRYGSIPVTAYVCRAQGNCHGASGQGGTADEASPRRVQNAHLYSSLAMIRTDALVQVELSCEQVFALLIDLRQGDQLDAPAVGGAYVCVVVMAADDPLLARFLNDVRRAQIHAAMGFVSIDIQRHHVHEMLRGYPVAGKIVDETCAECQGVLVLELGSAVVLGVHELAECACHKSRVFCIDAECIPVLARFDVGTILKPDNVSRGVFNGLLGRLCNFISHNTGGKGGCGNSGGADE